MVHACRGNGDEVADLDSDGVVVARVHTEDVPLPHLLLHNVPVGGRILQAAVDRKDRDGHQLLEVAEVGGSTNQPLLVEAGDTKASREKDQRPPSRILHYHCRIPVGGPRHKRSLVLTVELRVGRGDCGMPKRPRGCQSYHVLLVPASRLDVAAQSRSRTADVHEIALVCRVLGDGERTREADRMLHC